MFFATEGTYSPCLWFTAGAVCVSPEWIMSEVEVALILVVVGLVAVLISIAKPMDLNR